MRQYASPSFLLILAKESRVRVLVVKTQEEREIAREVILKL